MDASVGTAALPQGPDRKNMANYANQVAFAQILHLSTARIIIIKWFMMRMSHTLAQCSMC